MPRSSLLLAAVLALLVSARPATAAWSNTGNVVANTNFDEEPGYPGLNDRGSTVCPDMDGGLFVAYLRSGPSDTLRINRLDGVNGARQWGTLGVKVSTGGSPDGPAKVVTDRNRGAWVAWLDLGQLHVQRYDFNGNPQLVLGGKTIAAASGNGPDAIDVAVTDSGKLLVAFTQGGVRVQRVALDGTEEFGTEGILVTTDNGGDIYLMADGEGAVITWGSSRASLPGNGKVIGNRLDASGTILWGTEGSVVIAASGVTVSQHCSAWDGAVLWVAWKHVTSTFAGLHAQKMNLNGVQQAGPTGVIVATFQDTPWDHYATTQPNPRIVPSISQGCIIAWTDSRDHDRPAPNGFIHNSDIYGQRLTAGAIRQWGDDGAPLDSFPGTQEEVEMVSDEADGAILVYTDLAASADAFNDDIHARRIDTNHASLWSSFVTGIAPNDEQFHAVVAPDGAGGVCIAWEDQRDDANGLGNDVYATHRTQGGSTAAPSFTLTFPNGGESLSLHQPLTFTWTSTLGGNVKLEAQAAAGPRVLIVASTPDDGSFDGFLPGAVSGPNVRIFVSDAADGSPEDVSNAVFSVCSPPVAVRLPDPVPAANDVATADFNEDGILDLAFSVTPGVQVALGVANSGVGTGAWGSGVDYGNSLARDAVVADFNADEILDIAATTSAGVSVLFGNGADSVGNGTFGAYVSVAASPFNPRGIVTGDFNEDGIADLAWVNATTNNVSRILGNGSNGAGNGTFGSITSFTIGNSPSRVITGDFNEDGILDLATTNNTSGNISILLGLGAGAIGNGGFGAATNIAALTAPIGLASGDFNEDGITDLAVSGVSGVAVLPGNGAAGVGNGTFGAATVIAVGSNTRDVVVLDYNGDGRSDLMAAASGGDGAAFLFGNGVGTVGDGTFTFAGIDNEAGDFSNQMVVGDFLEDDAPDVVLTNSTSNDYSTLLGGCFAAQSTAITVTVPNSAAEFWVTGTNQTITWTKGAAVMAVDVEVSRDGGVSWMPIARNVTDNAFVWTVTPPTTITARIRVRDSNLQNRSDQSNANFAIHTTGILVKAPNGGESLRSLDVTTVIWAGVPGGNVKIEYTVGGGPRQLIVASTPNDNSELVAVPNVSSSQVRLFVSDAADGNPEDASDGVFSICQRMAAGVSTNVGTSNQGILTGDFNEDGITDLAVATDSGPDAIAVLLGQGAGGVGNGTFGAPTFAATGGRAFGIASGDFNDDGITDLVTTLFNSGSGVAISLGNGVNGVGNGTFAAGTPFAASSGSGLDVAVADLNEDGIDDIVFANTTTDRVSILIGNGSAGVGNGTFAEPVHVVVQDFPQELVIADFNVDGIWDIAVANLVTGSVSVLIGNGAGGVGDGTFAVPVHYAVSGARDLVAGEFDDEVGLDLAVIGGIQVRVLSGQGDGTFVPGAITALNGSPLEIAIMDMDFESYPDLVAAGGTGDPLSFLLNDSVGEFIGVGSFPIGTVPGGLVVSDFNEDGAHDIATGGGSTLLVFLGSLCGGTPGSVSLTEPSPSPSPSPEPQFAERGPARPAGAAQINATWPIGSNHIISWTKSPNVLAVDLAVSRDNGVNWEIFARGVTGTSYVWTVTPPQASTARLRVNDAASPAVSDASTTPLVINDPFVDVSPIELPTTASFSHGLPNPSHGDVDFSLALPRDADVSVDVFDVGGRRVGSLASGSLPAGWHRLRWSRGEKTVGGSGPGVYFVRARWEGFDVVRRVVRMP